MSERSNGSDLIYNTQRNPTQLGPSVLGKRDQGLAKTTTSPPRADVISHSKPLLQASQNHTAPRRYRSSSESLRACTT